MRTFHDFDLVEEAVQDAFASAAATWPSGGVPPSPQAWIVTAAKRSAIDRLRRAATSRRHAACLEPLLAAAPGDSLLDDELRLILLCAHPSLSTEQQIALTLRFVGGLTVLEIARLFRARPATISQRLARAKTKIREATITMRLPEPDHWADRIDVALAVVYGIYNEGYLPTTGALVRSELTREGIRLARRLLKLAPQHNEARGLVALLLLIDARFAARVDGDGSLIPLPQQDRTRWDRQLITEGQGLLRQCLRHHRPGPYQLQAAIQAVHSDAATDADTDWTQILRLYDDLLTIHPAESARTARVVALSKVHGPAEGLDALDGLPEDHYVLAIRADLLTQLGRHAEALEALTRASAQTENTAERAHLEGKVAAVSPDG